jgi:hypothetical protein
MEELRLRQEAPKARKKEGKQARIAPRETDEDKDEDERERLQTWIREQLSHSRPAPDERQVLNEMLAEPKWRDLPTLRAIWVELEPGMREMQERMRKAQVGGGARPAWMNASSIASRPGAAGDVMPWEGAGTDVPVKALTYPRGFGGVVPT